MGEAEFRPSFMVEHPDVREVAELPVDPAGEEVPPEPPFLVVRNKFGPGAHGVYLIDGTAVGVWLRDEHPLMDGPSVEALLIRMGLDADIAADYGRQRELAITARAELAVNPAVKMAAEVERQHDARTSAVREAFRQAMEKKR